MSERLESFSTYFKLVAELFHEFRWVYDFKATEVLSDVVKESVPVEFQNFFRSLHEADSQFHEILNLQENDQWPNGLREFTVKCKHLLSMTAELKGSSGCPVQVESIQEIVEGTGPLKLPKKWNPKKYAEVKYVGNFVGQLAKQEKCQVVVDIGSGLGYLSSYIASEFELPVIGLESEASRVKTAQSNYSSSCSSAGASQTFVCLRITKDISSQLQPYTKNYTACSLTALHACGDLTPWALSHFVRSDSCKMVSVVPCCYHKMDTAADNFPLSDLLRGALANYDEIEFLRNRWLWRLASQRAGNKFLNDISKETKNLFFRALLERYVVQEGLILKRKKRKANDMRFNTFSQYLEVMIGKSGIFEMEGSDKQIVNEDRLADIFCQISGLHKELNSWSQVITGILALQGAIQIIAEELILLDRLRFMEESESVKLAGIIRVIPDSVSPRGMVLFGIKK